MRVILSVTLLICEDVNPTGFIISLAKSELYLTLIEVEVPIPTEVFGVTSSFMVSPFWSPCGSEVLIDDTILSTFPVTWLKFVCSKYS